MMIKKILVGLVAVLGLALFLPQSSAMAGPTGNLTGTVKVRPSKYTAGVVVYLANVPGTYRAPARPAELDQKGMKFLPHVLAVVKGTTVAFLNSDNIRHNVFSPDHEKYDLGTWPQGTKKFHTFKNAGVYHQLCHVHPEMSGIVMVLDNPFFAVVGKNGKFSIPNVPAGTYTLHAWSEKLPEAKQKVTITAGGTAKITVQVKR